ncbi:MAG: protein-tyrosine-phosphatase [Bacteroidota bacterium]
MSASDFNPKLAALIIDLQAETDFITEERKTQLKSIGSQLAAMLEEDGHLKVNFICTHNSRRSQLGQIWLKAAAFWNDEPNISTFSGGTEATAFNHRMVAAVKRAGFDVKQLTDWENPKYYAPITEEDKTHDIYFSKKFANSYNPKSDFVAVMVCTDADKACPFVPGAKLRISLPYLDPKAYDDTPREAEEYNKKVREIGREMLYLMESIQNGK